METKRCMFADHVIVTDRHNPNFTEESLYSMICKTLLAQNRLEIIQELPEEYPHGLKIVWRLKEETKGECTNASR